MHFSQGLPLATLLLLSLTTATPVPGKLNNNAIAVRRNIASVSATNPIHAQLQKRGQGDGLDSTGLVSDDDSASTGLVNDDPENLKKTKRQDPQSDSSPSSDDSQPAGGADADQDIGVTNKVRRRPWDPSSCSDGSEKLRRDGSCNDGSEKTRRDDADDDRYGFGPGSDGWKKMRRDDADDDRYGFGPGSDGWKKVRRDDIDDSAVLVDLGDTHMAGAYPKAPDVGYNGEKSRRDEDSDNSPSNDDFGGFGRGSDGWKKTRRNDDDSIDGTNLEDPKMTGGYSVAPDVGYKGKKARRAPHDIEVYGDTKTYQSDTNDIVASPGDSYK